MKISLNAHPLLLPHANHLKELQNKHCYVSVTDILTAYM